MNHIELGRYGEELASKYLIAHGYTVIDRNIRYRFGEVDIIRERGLLLSR